MAALRSIVDMLAKAGIGLINKTQKSYLLTVAGAALVFHQTSRLPYTTNRHTVIGCRHLSHGRDFT